MTQCGWAGQALKMAQPWYPGVDCLGMFEECCRMAEAQTAPSGGTSHVHKTGAGVSPLSLTQQNPHLCSVLAALNPSALLFCQCCLAP